MLCTARACCALQITTGYRYLPFGGGRRKCIGDQFALFESVVALAMLQRRYTFEMHETAGPIEMVSGATIHTNNGLPVRLRPRGPAAGGNGTSGNGVAAADGVPVAGAAGAAPDRAPAGV